MFCEDCGLVSMLEVVMFNTREQVELLRVIAKHCGISGSLGGWLSRNGKPICQGWHAFWNLCHRRKWIVACNTGTWIRRGCVCKGWRVDWRAVV